ncbi:hypothetical protein [Myroides sp. TSA_177.3]|uniref:hypothetical protein n=1 Tax=Myroides sp. TSA_177.3 TaxID=3415650 RepID=UPI004045A903
MKTVHLKLFFPRNWYHARKLKIYANNKKLAWIMHNQTIEIQIPKETQSLEWKLDYFKNTISLPNKKQPLYILLSMNVGRGTLQLYLKTLKRKCIQGKIVTQEEFENSTSTTIYQNDQEWFPRIQLDKSILFIGLLIGIISLVYAVFMQTEWRDIVFLLGGGTILSLLILIFEKNKIALGEYKNRMWASIGSFILTIFLIPTHDFAIQMLLIILTIGFILRFLLHIKKLQAK